VGAADPGRRGETVRDLARILRENATELAPLDAAAVGLPITAMRQDVALGRCLWGSRSRPELVDLRRSAFSCGAA
jgi:hypothetical protein